MCWDATNSNNMSELDSRKMGVLIVFGEREMNPVQYNSGAGYIYITYPLS